MPTRSGLEPAWFAIHFDSLLIRNQINQCLANEWVSRFTHLWFLIRFDFDSQVNHDSWIRIFLWFFIYFGESKWIDSVRALNKVETIGDAYVAVSGAPTHKSTTNHGSQICLFALKIQKEIENVSNLQSLILKL